ncbi:MAG: AMP-dependent synthetase/ligase [Planctomycetota bacterium]|nr:AMP-dependent synthetase/ligase [Planctomycetota bacterium]
MTEDTVPGRLFGQARRIPQRPAYHEKVNGQWKATSWAEYGVQVRKAGKALIALGVEKGSSVAILGSNRPEWVIMAQGAMAIGAVPAGIYISSPPEEIAFKINHAEASIILVESAEQLERVKKAQAEAPNLKHLVLFRGSVSSEDSLSWDDFLKKGDEVKDVAFDQRLASLKGEDLATLIYTSGTTGNPKAVMLSHRNISWTSSIAPQITPLDENDACISYLPLSHIAEQMFSLHCPATVGAQVYFAESREKLLENMKEIQPTLFFGVPRVWEKMHSKLAAGLGQATGIKGALVKWARGVAGQMHALSFEGREAGPWLAWQYRFANKLFTKIKTKRLGLGRSRYLISGAAPLGKDVLEFFATLDMPILEVYGQSEDTGPTSFNRPGKTRFGTVGPPIPGVEVKIAEDGEILVKGQNVFMGYYKNPEATAETLKDGWLYSGDLGHLDEDGFLHITGRKKDIIINAAGKNIAPKDIEAGLKSHFLVNEAVLVGDRQPYCVALLTLDEEAAVEYAAEHHLKVEDLPKNDALIANIQETVDEVNSKNARVAGVKKFRILERPFSVETGELTPTLKVKRNVVQKSFESVINELYASGKAPPGNG